MNSRSQSRLPSEGTYFEIQQSSNQVVIVTRDRATDEVCQVVTFRGGADLETGNTPCEGSERGMRPALAVKRW